LDRVLERGRVLHFKGPSYRTRHLSQGGSIISGKAGPEFREPTSFVEHTNSYRFILSDDIVHEARVENATEELRKIVL
jgi:hypothetical protein